MKFINIRMLQPPSPTRDVIAEDNTTPASILSSEHTKLTVSWVLFLKVSGLYFCRQDLLCLALDVDFILG